MDTPKQLTARTEQLIEHLGQIKTTATPKDDSNKKLREQIAQNKLQQTVIADDIARILRDLLNYIQKENK